MGLLISCVFYCQITFEKQNFIKFAFAERLKVEAVVNNYVKQRK